MSRREEQASFIQDFARDLYQSYQGLHPTLEEALEVLHSGALDAALERLPEAARLAAVIDYSANFFVKNEEITPRLPTIWAFGTWEKPDIDWNRDIGADLELPKFFYDAVAKERGIKRVQSLPVDPRHFSEAAKQAELEETMQTPLAVDQQGDGLQLMTEPVWYALRDMQEMRNRKLEQLTRLVPEKSVLLSTKPNLRRRNQVRLAQNGFGNSGDGHSASDSLTQGSDDLAYRARFMIMVDARTGKVIMQS